MNASAAGIAPLRARGANLPREEELLTGVEFADRYLSPLATNLGAPIHLRTEIVAIARDATRKTEKIGEPERAERLAAALLGETGGD